MKASSKTTISLAIAGSVAVGILLGSTIFANMLPGTASGTPKQALTIAGTETLKVIAPDGKVVSTWQGPDPLFSTALDAIASCVTGTNGGSTSPYGFGSCASWIGKVIIDVDGPTAPCTHDVFFTPSCEEYSSVATNYLTPQGCSTSSITPPAFECSGWTTEAVFPPTTFTQQNCGTSCHVEQVSVLSSNGFTFDYLCTTGFVTAAEQAALGLDCTLGSGAIPPVSSGDTLVVTIAFSIS